MDPPNLELSESQVLDMNQTLTSPTSQSLMQFLGDSTNKKQKIIRDIQPSIFKAREKEISRAGIELDDIIPDDFRLYRISRSFVPEMLLKAIAEHQIYNGNSTSQITGIEEEKSSTETKANEIIDEVKIGNEEVGKKKTNVNLTPTGDSLQPFSVPINSTVLLADLSGFTRESERLCSKGRDGMDELDRVMYNAFSKLVNTFYAHGGDVIKFAGDALIVCWAAQDNETIEENAIRAIQCAHELASGPPVSENMHLHIGISTGVVEFVVVGHAARKEYSCFISGQALVQMGIACDTAMEGEVVLHPSCYDIAQQRVEGNVVGDIGCVKLSQIKNTITPKPLKRHKITFDDLKNLLMFVPYTFHTGQKVETETREIFTIFVKFEGTMIDDILSGKKSAIGFQEIFYMISNILERSGGMMRQFLVDDKGVVLIAAFGVPNFVHGDDPFRALNCALSMSSSLEIKLGVNSHIGITTGRAFCGFVGIDLRKEYVVAGDTVNSSARLMGLSAGKKSIPTLPKGLESPERGNNTKNSRVICDEKVRQVILNANLSGHFSFTRMETAKLKGKKKNVQAYIVEPPSDYGLNIISFDHKCVGRNAELNDLDTIMQDSSIHTFALAACGDSGTGKSTFLYSALKKGFENGYKPIFASSIHANVGNPYSAIVWIMRFLLPPREVSEDDSKIGKKMLIFDDADDEPISMSPLMTGTAEQKTVETNAATKEQESNEINKTLNEQKLDDENASSTEYKIDECIDSTIEHKMDDEVGSTIQQKSNEVNKSTSEEKSNEVNKSTSEEKSNEVNKSTSEEKSNEVNKSTSEQKTNEITNSTSEQKLNEANVSTSEQKSSDIDSRSAVKETTEESKTQEHKPLNLASLNRIVIEGKMSQEDEEEYDDVGELPGYSMLGDHIIDDIESNKKRQTMMHFDDLKQQVVQNEGFEPTLEELYEAICVVDSNTWTVDSWDPDTGDIDGHNAPSYTEQMYQLLRPLFVNEYIARKYFNNVFIALDDVHLIDDCSWTLFSEIVKLISTMKDVRFGVIMSTLSINEAKKQTRSSQIVSLLKGLDSKEHSVGKIVPLRPLARDDIKEMLCDLFPQHEKLITNDDFVEFAMRTSDGNPFMAKELAQGRIKKLTGLQSDKPTRNHRDRSNSTLGVSKTIERAIVARIDALSSRARKVILVASVIGKDFLYVMLRNLLPPTFRINMIPEELQAFNTEYEKTFNQYTPNLDNFSVLDAALIELLEKDFIIRIEGSEAVQTKEQQRFMFNHGMVLIISYNLMMETEKKRRHKRAARWIESTYQDDLRPYFVRLMIHYFKSGEIAKAADYAVRAVRMTIRAGALCESMELYNFAIEMVVISNDETTEVVRQKQMGQKKLLKGLNLFQTELRNEGDLNEQVPGNTIEVVNVNIAAYHAFTTTSGVYSEVDRTLEDKYNFGCSQHKTHLSVAFPDDQSAGSVNKYKILQEMIDILKKLISEADEGNSTDNDLIVQEQHVATPAIITTNAEEEPVVEQSEVTTSACVIL